MVAVWPSTGPVRPLPTPVLVTWTSIVAVPSPWSSGSPTTTARVESGSSLGTVAQELATWALETAMSMLASSSRPSRGREARVSPV